MGGKRGLKHGAPRLLGYHGGREGKAYCQHYADLETQYGPFNTNHQRFEAGRVVIAMLQLTYATVSLTAAQKKRARGRGRRPNERQVERLARRHGLADGTYHSCIRRLEELTAKKLKTNPTPEELIPGANDGD